MTTGAKVGIILGSVAFVSIIVLVIVEMNKPSPVPPPPPVTTTTTTTVGGLGNIIGGALKTLI